MKLILSSVLFLVFGFTAQENYSVSQNKNSIRVYRFGYDIRIASDDSSDCSIYLKNTFPIIDNTKRASCPSIGFNFDKVEVDSTELKRIDISQSKILLQMKVLDSHYADPLRVAGSRESIVGDYRFQISKDSYIAVKSQITGEEIVHFGDINYGLRVVCKDCEYDNGVVIYKSLHDSCEIVEYFFIQQQTNKEIKDFVEVGPFKCL